MPKPKTSSFPEAVKALVDLARQWDPGDIAAPSLSKAIYESLESNPDAILTACSELEDQGDTHLAQNLFNFAIELACLRWPGRLYATCLVALPLRVTTQFTLTDHQTKQLSRIIGEAWDGKVTFFPITVDRGILYTVEPGELWALHQAKQFPAGFPTSAEPAGQTQLILGVLKIPGEWLAELDWDRPQDDIAAQLAPILGLPPGEIGPFSRILQILLEDSSPLDRAYVEFTENLDAAIEDLGVSAEQTRVALEEREPYTLAAILLTDGPHVVEIRLRYGQGKISRAEAFLLVYDVLKGAGVAAIVMKSPGELVDQFPTNGVRH
jgi:hypothetical protein